MNNFSGIVQNPGCLIDLFFRPYHEAAVHLKKAFSLKDDWDYSFKITFSNPQKTLKIDSSKRIKHLLAGCCLLVPLANVIALLALKYFKTPPAFPLKSVEKLMEEFRSLPAPYSCEELHPLCPTAVKNFIRNNYNNTFPFEDNVYRHPDDPDFFYNASYLLNGKIIAAQAPKIFGHDEFWEMTWESNSPVIVMLTNYMESGTLKCSQYFPFHLMTWQFGKITVKDLGKSRIYRHPKENEKIIKRTLVITKDGKEKNITHFHLKNWSDHRAAQKETLAYLVRKVRRHMQFLKRTKGKKTGPLITHCSAGIGRTGTFIAAYEGEKRLSEGANPAYLVKKIAKELRSRTNGRNGMIQTIAQYILVHQTLHGLHPG